jgi:hypothetical protein
MISLLEWKTQQCRVTIEYADDSHRQFIVRGYGTPYQIMLLKNELLLWIYFGRASSYGAIKTMASQYFMEGSTFVYPRGGENKDAMMKLKPLHYESNLHRQQYENKEKSTLILQSNYEHPHWIDQLKMNLKCKIIEQFNSLVGTKSTEVIEFSVHLGKLVLLDAYKALERSYCLITAEGLEHSMTLNRRNKKFANYFYDDYDVKNDDKQVNVPLEKQTDDDGDQNHRANHIKETKADVRKKVGIGSSFISSIPIRIDTKTMNQSDNIFDTLDVIEKRLLAIHETLGYQELIPSDLIPLERERIERLLLDMSLYIPDPSWRVAMDITTTRSGHIDLNVDQKLVQVSERFLSWVNGTLINCHISQSMTETNVESNESKDTWTWSNTEVNPNVDAYEEYSFKYHDIRLKIGTTNQLTPESSLYQRMCPQDKLPVEFHSKTINISDLHNGVYIDDLIVNRKCDSSEAVVTDKKRIIIFPKPLNDHIQPGMIQFVRHVRKRRLFLNPSLACHLGLNGSGRHGVNVMTVISIGEHFEGKELEKMTPFIDISIEIDTTMFKKYLNHNQNLMDNCESDICQVVYTSEDLSQHIDEIINEILCISNTISRMWE